MRALLAEITRAEEQRPKRELGPSKIDRKITAVNFAELETTFADRLPEIS